MRTANNLLLNTLRVVFVSAGFLIILTACSGTQKNNRHPSRNTKTVKDIIPLTVSNLKGHKTLFREGFYIISSSEKAFEYAKEHSVISSRQAIKMVITDYSASSRNFLKESKENFSGIPGDVKKVIGTGTDTTKEIIRFTRSAAKGEMRYGSRQFQKAWESLISGNINIIVRSEEDRESLRKIPEKYYKSIKKDLSNVNQVSEFLLNDYKESIRSSWDGAFERAASEFDKGYRASGEKKNSLSALGPLLAGYGKSLYSGFFSPAGKSGVTIGKKVVKTSSLAVSGAVIVTGRTFQSLGLTFYYVGKMGFHLVSPTVKSGVLTALASLSYGAVPVTYAAGGGVGAINQVAFAGAAPLYAVGKGGVNTAVSTGKYSGLLLYDGIKGSSKVVINQVKTGVVLGYNAITALPAHLFMAVPDAILLAWDGPRLVLAAVKGEVRTGREGPSGKTYAVGDLPVGSVVNMDLLEKNRDLKVKIITDDPKIIEKVLDELPDDLRR